MKNLCWQQHKSCKRILSPVDINSVAPKRVDFINVLPRDISFISLIGAIQMYNQIYTLPQKKRKFNQWIFPGDPGSGSVTPGHVK